MNPNLGRDIASKQAKWLLELKDLIKRQAITETPEIPATAAPSKSPASGNRETSPSGSDATEIVEPDMDSTTANAMNKVGKGLHWQTAPLDYPRYTLDPAFITNRFVCPSLSKYVLPQWMLDEMATNSHAISKTPRNLPRFRKGRIPADAGNLPLSGDRTLSARPAILGDVPTLVVEDVPTLPVVEDMPTLPVVHDDDIPTMPVIEAPISDRALRHFPSTSVHTPTRPFPEHVEATTDRLQRKRKRAESGALERAVCKASLMKRRKRDAREGVEKENVKLKKRRLARRAMEEV